MKTKKPLLLVIASTIAILFLLIVTTYYYSFAPKIEVKDINSNITLDKKALLVKFLPTDFKLSLKEVYVESTADFSEDELTDLFILLVQENPDLKAYISGLKVDIYDNNINLYFNLKFKNIPIQGKITFTGKSKDNMGIFHFKEGKIGFIPLSKDYIFSQTIDTSVVRFDKLNGDILLSFEEIKQLEVRDVSVINNKIELTFRGTVRFWDWITK